MFVISRAIRTVLATTALLALAAAGQPSASLWAQGQTRSDVLITFRSPVGELDRNLVRGLGGTVTHSYTIVPGIAASLPAPAIAALANNPRVAVVEPDGVFYANDEFDDELAQAWGIGRVGAGALHPGEIGAGVRVAVIDSGIACDHPDLLGQCAGGHDFVNGDDDPYDDDGHGTHVGGTIAAKRNGQGVVGVAPGAILVPLKVLNASGSGSFSSVIAALNWAATNDIQVTNNSYGSSQNPGSLVEAAFANTAAQGMLHIGSAGNSGRCSAKGNTVGFPAQYASVVAVAATTVTDSRPCFSSHGPAVEISAPGVNIRSTVPGGGYANWNGTSMASPHVAGVAALLIGTGVFDTSDNPSLDDEVRAILQSTADDLGAAGRDEQFGFGLVNAVAAVAAATGGVTPTPEFTVHITTDKASYAPGENVEVTVSVTDETSAQVSGLGGGAFAMSLDGSGIALPLTDQGGGSYTGTLDGSALSAGGHTLAVVVDDGTRSGQDSTTFSVDAAPGGTLAVTDVSFQGYGGKNSDKHFTVTIRIEASGAPVGGANVAINLLRGGSVVGTAAGTTDGAGNVSFSVTNPASGEYSIEVTSVTAGSLTWDGQTPSNSYNQS